MDTTDPKQVRTAFSAQGTKIHKRESQLSPISWVVKELTAGQEVYQTSVTSQINYLVGQLNQVLTHLGTTSPLDPLAENQVAVPSVIPAALSTCFASLERFSEDSHDWESRRSGYSRMVQRFPNLSLTKSFSISLTNCCDKTALISGQSVIIICQVPKLQSTKKWQSQYATNNDIPL